MVAYRPGEQPSFENNLSACQLTGLVAERGGHYSRVHKSSINCLRNIAHRVFNGIFDVGPGSGWSAPFA